MHLLIWDFDGTLGYREGGWSGALLEVLNAHGLSRDVTRSAISAHLKTGFPWHVPDETRETTTADDWWRSLEPIFAGAFAGVGFQKGVASRLATEVRAAYLEPTRFTLYPDTLPVLEQLSACGWQHVLLTNHVPELPLILDYLGLQSSFARVFNSADTGIEKPQARAFENVLEAFRPRTVWMIGDNPVADIAGAEAVGLRAILVRQQDMDAKYVCADLHEVVRVLETFR